jgi:NAD(P)H-flavin reductase
MKTIRAAVPEPEVVPSTTQLPEEALDLIDSADCFFLTSSNVGETLSTNYRGGPKGFIRVLPPSAVVPDSSTSNSIELLENDPENTTQLPLIRLIYPEYSGNRLYQTLGNLYTTPQAGIAIPDLLTGTVLYATCTTQIVAGLTASSLLPRSNLAVILTMTEYYLVRNSLGFRATASENGMSPYNPPVRYLSSEHTAAGSSLRPKQHNNPQAIATIVGKEMLGPGRARVTFETDNPVHWTPGQYVALSFAGELDTGYSHMRDDDPQSLNEDWVRTFTVTSPAPREPADSTTKESGEAHAPTDAGPTAKRFEVTVRNVGPCTGLLVKSNPRAGTELAVLGFGGSFDIRAKKGETVLFVAGGVGITPLLGQIERLRRMGVGIELAWAVKKGDVEFIKGVCEAWRMTEAVDVHVFVSGGIDEAGSDALQAAGVTLVGRRLEGGDMDGFGAEKWYVCAGKSLAQAVEGWADARGAEIVGESFAY